MARNKPRETKTPEDALKEAQAKLSERKTPLTNKELAALLEDDLQVTKNPSAHYLVDKKGRVQAVARTRKEILETKRRIIERKQGIEHKSVDILKKNSN